MGCIIGIDVGGTHTNIALLTDRQVVGTGKVPTDHNDLLGSVSAALDEIKPFLPGIRKNEIELHLSTTLATNAIVENKGEPAVAIVSYGPGMHLSDYDLRVPMKRVKGVIDHRGREVLPVDKEEVREVLKKVEEEGFKAVAVIGKFSPRNPAHEFLVAELISREFPGFSPVTLGHKLSGRLNFPRRVTTAYLNARVAKIQHHFAEAIKQIIQAYRVKKVFFLKADGGTLQLNDSLSRPVETILSGPASSVMGALALSENLSDAVVLDIGGTTTEISVLFQGEPLTERNGAEINGFKTLVPALFSRSLGLGGDSKVRFIGEKLEIGPRREGPPAALGGPEVTPTDAAVVLGKITLGNKDRARRCLEKLGQPYNLPPVQLAEQIIKVFCCKVAEGILKVYDYLNSLPVYTVSEILAPGNLQPKKIIGMGGPANFFIPLIAEQMKLPYELLPFYEAANAIGAAASRPTAAITFRADTALGRIVVPELDYVSAIPRPLLYGVQQAREDALAMLKQYVSCFGKPEILPQMEITEEETFHLVRGFHTVGRIFHLKAQVRPGVCKVCPGT